MAIEREVCFASTKNWRNLWYWRRCQCDLTSIPVECDESEERTETVTEGSFMLHVFFFVVLFSFSRSYTRISRHISVWQRRVDRICTEVNAVNRKETLRNDWASLFIDWKNDWTGFSATLSLAEEYTTIVHLRQCGYSASSLTQHRTALSILRQKQFSRHRAEKMALPARSDGRCVSFICLPL